MNKVVNMPERESAEVKIIDTKEQNNDGVLCGYDNEVTSKPKVMYSKNIYEFIRKSYEINKEKAFNLPLRRMRRKLI